MRKPLAALLIFAWVVISGFDLLEDLNFGAGSSSYTQSPTGKALPPYLKHQSRLVNNVIESAISERAFGPSLVELMRAPSLLQAFLSFHKVFSLHKLHRVFLI